VIKLIEGLADAVVGIEAVGKVSSEDYAEVVVPAVERALARRGGRLVERRARGMT
jgi:hypothetical protein